MTVGRMDVLDGGTWRYIEGMPGHVSLQTITFEEDGATTLGAVLDHLPVGRGP